MTINGDLCSAYLQNRRKLSIFQTKIVKKDSPEPEEYGCIDSGLELFIVAARMRWSIDSLCRQY
jgi:hypothetical protein